MTSSGSSQQVYGWVITPPQRSSIPSLGFERLSRSIGFRKPPNSKIEHFRERETGERVLCFRGRPARVEDMMYIRRTLEEEEKYRNKTSGLVIMFCNLTDELLSLFLTRSVLNPMTTSQSPLLKDQETVASTMLTSIRKLQLGSNSIGDLGVSILSRAIRASNLAVLTRLDLGSNLIGCTGAETIAKLLPDCPGLIQLDLSANGIQDYGASQLGKAIAKSRSLKMISLEANLIQNGGFRDFAEGIRNNYTLQVINLAYNVRLNDECYPDLLRGIRSHRSVREISLEGTEVSVYLRMLLRRQILVLHTERAKVLTAILSAHHVRGLNRQQRNSAKVAMLPSDLIRLVDLTLYDPRTGTAPPTLKPNALTVDSLTMFVILQALLCFWAFVGAVMINWV